MIILVGKHLLDMEPAFRILVESFDFCGDGDRPQGRGLSERDCTGDAGVPAQDCDSLQDTVDHVSIVL